MPNLESLLARLIERKVEFVVIGGYAAVAHGATLMTQDIDLCCRFSVENLMRLQDALGDLRPVHRMTSAKLPLQLTPEECRQFKNLYLQTDYGQLDCLSSVLGVGDYEAVKAQSVEVQLAAGSCRILSLNALIQSKEAMGRPRDLDAALQLRAIRERSGESANGRMNE